VEGGASARLAFDPRRHPDLGRHQRRHRNLGALIGAGGLGQPILTGIRLDDLSLILEGAIPAALLALMVQALSKRLATC